MNGINIIVLMLPDLTKNLLIKKCNSSCNHFYFKTLKSVPQTQTNVTTTQLALIPTAPTRAHATLDTKEMENSVKV